MKTPLWAEEYKRLMSGEYCEVEAKKTFGLPIDFAFPLALAAPGMPSQLPRGGIDIDALRAELARRIARGFES